MVARERQIEYSTQTVRKRLQSTLSRGPADFIDNMLRHRGDKEKGLADKKWKLMPIYSLLPVVKQQ